MTNEELLSLLRQGTFSFSAKVCRDENISLVSAQFLRWLFVEGSCTNRQIFDTFGAGRAYELLRMGFVSSELGEREGAQTNLWKVTENSSQLLQRLTKKR